MTLSTEHLERSIATLERSLSMLDGASPGPLRLMPAFVADATSLMERLDHADA